MLEEDIVENEGQEFDPSKYAALDKEFSKKFGEAYNGFTSKKQKEKINFVSLECLSLNKMLGGGLPEGRIIEIFGPASNGKSTLALHIVSSFQKQNKVCFWLDGERAYNEEYALQCGVDTDKLAMFDPETANDALDAMRIAASSGQIDLIILDSVASLVPKDEYEKDIGGGMIGSLARLLSSSLKQLAVLADKNKCTIVLLNQERSSGITGYGPKTTTAGGSSIGYYTSVRIDVNRTGYIENSAKDKLGINLKAQTVKNKTTTPFKEAEYDILFPHMENGETVAGIDIVGDVINLAVKFNLIVKSGSWFAYKEAKCQGLEKLRAELTKDSNLYNEIYKSVVERIEE